MTIGALGFGMGAQQWETGLLGVIKLRTFPCLNRVAFLAL